MNTIYSKRRNSIHLLILFFPGEGEAFIYKYYSSRGKEKLLYINTILAGRRNGIYILMLFYP
ncbi:MAG: hypothetical protein ACLFT6_07020, partial [Bacteroidales bacterium]